MSQQDRFIGILVDRLTRKQLHEILEDVTAAYDYGHCPLCGWQEVPVDEHGDEVDHQNNVTIVGYREEHDADCPVAIIENYLSQSEAKTV